MLSNFVICLIILLVVIYLTDTMGKMGKMGKKEKFSLGNSNIYEPINRVGNKIIYLYPPDLDYQDDLNEISGYDSGTRGYNNYLYAKQIAADLDTN